jgi:hypothetical protein
MVRDLHCRRKRRYEHRQTDQPTERIGDVMKRKTISLLTLQEWCDYWSEGNTQYLEDGRDIGSDGLAELCAAACAMRTLIDLVDGVEVPEHDPPDRKSVV